MTWLAKSAWPYEVGWRDVRRSGASAASQTTSRRSDGGGGGGGGCFPEDGEDEAALAADEALLEVGWCTLKAQHLKLKHFNKCFPILRPIQLAALH